MNRQICKCQFSDYNSNNFHQCPFVKLYVRGNGERERKWREWEEMEREWRNHKLNLRNLSKIFLDQNRSRGTLTTSVCLFNMLHCHLTWIHITQALFAQFVLFLFQIIVFIYRNFICFILGVWYFGIILAAGSFEMWNDIKFICIWFSEDQILCMIFTGPRSRGFWGVGTLYEPGLKTSKLLTCEGEFK